MSFQIPDDLSRFSVTGLTQILAEAKAEYDTVFAAADPETIDDAGLDYLQSLQEFVRVTGPQAIADARNGADAQKARAERLSALAADPEPEVEPVIEGEPVVEGEPEPVVASTKVRLADVISRQRSTPDKPTVTAPKTYSTLVAAAGVPNYDAGTELSTMLDVAKAFEARSASHGRINAGRGAGPVMYPVAQLVRNYPAEFSVNGDETDYAKLLQVSDEARLPGGNLLNAVEARQKELLENGARGDALVAAAGWCAPSETDYSICLQISTDGMYDAPEVQARRGGIRHNTGIQFDDIFGGGNCSDPTGFFDLTEAQVAAGTTKTCLEIDCPDFVDTRLGVTGLCLTGNILSIRGYPEYTATFTRGALAAHAHQVNREQIADVVTASTAVNLTSAAPWATDGSTVSQVMSAVEMAIVDIKYRMRLQRSATLEVVMPWWILAQMRADWIRRTFGGSGNSEQITLADSVIASGFSARGARVQYVYDWQDAFATCATSGSPGADTAINNLPTSLQFLVYPAGTWVRAVSDVITLNSVYDSTKLATNQVTHLFTETGWAMVQMCPVSRVYTVPICPSGKTTATGTLTCPS
jgi:hypothetical protein